MAAVVVTHTQQTAAARVAARLFVRLCGWPAACTPGIVGERHSTWNRLPHVPVRPLLKPGRHTLAPRAILEHWRDDGYVAFSGCCQPSSYRSESEHNLARPTRRGRLQRNPQHARRCTRRHPCRLQVCGRASSAPPSQQPKGRAIEACSSSSPATGHPIFPATMTCAPPRLQPRLPLSPARCLRRPTAQSTSTALPKMLPLSFVLLDQ